MKKEHNLVKLEDKENNVVNFEEIRKAVTGGFDGDENWLKSLSVGTVFVAKRKDAPKEILFCDLFCVLDHKDKVSNLLQKIPNGQQADLWYKSLEFSRKNELIEVIAEVKLEYDLSKKEQEEPEDNLTEELDDGSSDRAV